MAKSNIRTKIYTKRGDTGSTSLVTGATVKKNHPRLECYGTVDELNSIIGIALCLLNNSSIAGAHPLIANLVSTQNYLFTIGSHLACDDTKFAEKLPPLENQEVSQIEISIDEMEQGLPPLKNFILPGGCLASAHLHAARTVCRRAERAVLDLQQSTEVDARILIYLNRLSDFLFVAARYCNSLFKTAEVVWKSR